MSEAKVSALAALEIGVPDVDAAVTFYEKVWGLSTVDRVDDACYLRAGGAHYYVLALHRAAEACCIRVRLSAVDRNSVDALADRVTKAGGKVVCKPSELKSPGGGYGFAFRDIEDREWEVQAEARTHAVKALPNDCPYRLSHVVFNSTNLDGAADFMRDALGFRLRDRTAKAGFMGCNADHHSVAFTNRPNTLLGHVAFELANLEAFMRGCGRLKRAGLTLEWGVGRHGTGDNAFAYYVDPNGFVIEYTTEMQQVDDRTYVPGSPESIARAAHSDVWGLADPPTARFIQALNGPGARTG